MSKILIMLLPIMLSSCVTLESSLSDSEKEARSYYEKEVKKKSTFLMNCDDLTVKPGELYYHEWQRLLYGIKTEFFKKVNPKTEKNAAKFPLTFLVSGCNKRVELMLLHPGRTIICTPDSYFNGQCIVVQDSSFTNSKQ